MFTFTPPLFNPTPRISHVEWPGGGRCIVVDDALAHPREMVAWARTLHFAPPAGYPYPGLVVDVPPQINEQVRDHFVRHVRSDLGVRRVLESAVRLSLVTTPPEALEPRQWLCHRDRIAADPQRTLFAASVLYLFEDPTFGGTSFYRPRRDSVFTDTLIAHSQILDAGSFTQRYGLRPGYMADGNAYFDRVATVPAAWNRMVFYDGGLFHSADVAAARALGTDPSLGRLTLNGFFTCQRNAR